MSETETASAEAAAEPAAPVHCRHCGQPAPDDLDATATPDWLCPSCEHYQDAMICPTCGSNARISLLPAELAPAPHEPAKRKRSGG